MSTESDELQELVLADARNIYSETVIDHAMNPRNVGDMQDADGFARVTGPCGDTMEVWLKVDSDAIAITSGATLKEALSRMLSQGMNNIPVIDSRGRITGEITLGDVEAATKETEV